MIHTAQKGIVISRFKFMLRPFSGKPGCSCRSICILSIQSLYQNLFLDVHRSPGASDLPWQRLAPRKQRRSSICAAFMATSKDLMRTHRSFGPFMPLRFSLLTRLPSEIFNVCSAVSEGLAEVQRTGDLSPGNRRGFVEIVEYDTK